MAVAGSNLRASSSGVSASSYSIASISPVANNLILVTIGNSLAAGSVTTPTISGGGIATWVQVSTKVDASNIRRITVFRGMSASPSSAGITIDFGGVSQDRCHWSVEQFSGVDTTGTNGSGAIVQSATNTNSGTQSGITVTLAAFGSANNATFGAVRKASVAAITVGSGFTALSNSTSNSAAFTVEFNAGNDTTVDWTWASASVNVVAIAIEIAAAPVSISGVLSATLAALTGSNTGTVKVQGTSAKTLAALTVSSAGAVKVQGTSAKTLAPATLLAAGAAVVRGVLTRALGALSLTSAGTSKIAGSVSSTLGALTASASGRAKVQGTAAGTLAPATLVGTGGATASTSGALGATLAPVALLAVGTVSAAVTPPQGAGSGGIENRHWYREDYRRKHAVVPPPPPMPSNEEILRTIRLRGDDEDLITILMLMEE